MSCFGLRPILHILDFCVPLNSPFPASLSAFNPDIHLTVDDIAVDSHTSPSCLQLTTDPFQKGCCLYIGLGHPPLCALSAIMNYLPLRGQSPGSLFLLSNGQPLSCTLLTHWLKDIFAAAGIQGSFSSHSFRIGAATVAARMGVPDHLIQAVGRWNSDAYKLYIRTPVEALAQATSLLSHWPWESVSFLKCVFACCSTPLCWVAGNWCLGYFLER